MGLAAGGGLTQQLNDNSSSSSSTRRSHYSNSSRYGGGEEGALRPRRAPPRGWVELEPAAGEHDVQQVLGPRDARVWGLGNRGVGVVMGRSGYPWARVTPIGRAFSGWGAQ